MWVSVLRNSVCTNVDQWKYNNTTVFFQHNLSGIVMMCLALSSDAAIGNVQEKYMLSSDATNAEVVSFVIILP